MKKWNVTILPDAEDDIGRIYSYIVNSLFEPVIAGRLVKRIKKAILSLDKMPERYRLFDKKPWHSKGLRLFSVGNFIIFYHTAPEIDTVFIDSVVYGGRDIDRIIEEIMK